MGWCHPSDARRQAVRVEETLDLFSPGCLAMLGTQEGPSSWYFLPERRGPPRECPPPNHTHISSCTALPHNVGTETPAQELLPAHRTRTYGETRTYTPAAAHGNIHTPQDLSPCPLVHALAISANVLL